MIKKTILAVIAASAFTATATAQEIGFGFGAKVGINISNQTKDLNADAKAGFTGGVFADYRFSDLVVLSADVLYSRQGAKVNDDKLATDNLNIPILANFYLVEGLAVKAGVQPGFLLAANEKIHGTKTDVKDHMKTFDFSIPVGLSYTFGCGLMLDARYSIGVTNVSKGDAVKSRNSVWSLTAGWRF